MTIKMINIWANDSHHHALGVRRLEQQLQCGNDTEINKLDLLDCQVVIKRSKKRIFSLHPFFR